MPQQVLEGGKAALEAFEAEHMTEAQFSVKVLREAAAQDWTCYHTWRSDHSAAGYPDLTLVRRDRICFAELKSEHGRVKPIQLAWLGALRATGKVEVYLWRPSMMEEVRRVLA